VSLSVVAKLADAGDHARKPSAARPISKAEARRRVAEQVRGALAAGLVEDWINEQPEDDRSALSEAERDLMDEMERRATPAGREAARLAR
jgi:hypothetical protein